MRTWCIAIGVALCMSATASGVDSVVQQANRATGIDAGVVVHVGTSDGMLELDLARSGRFLVQGLTLDEAKRD